MRKLMEAIETIEGMEESELTASKQARQDLHDHIMELHRDDDPDLGAILYEILNSVSPEKAELILNKFITNSFREG